MAPPPAGPACTRPGRRCARSSGCGLAWQSRERGSARHPAPACLPACGASAAGVALDEVTVPAQIGSLPLQLDRYALPEGP